MFKFSKKKSSGSDVVVADMNGKEATDVIESTCVKENGDSSNLTTCSSLNNSPDLEHDVKRLNSLDSGIVVEKGCDNPVANVEYAIPQKKEIKQHDENSDRETVNGKIEANESDDDLGKVIGQRLAEPIYINGDKDDEDFVYINERAVDVGNLSKSECSIVEAVENGPDGINYSSIGNDQAAKEDSKSNASSDSGTGMNSKIQYVDKPENPTGAKLKKKSWSFQFGRKKSTDREKTTANKDHDEVDGSPKEHKKQKWRFGKFSLKKSSEITASTPNLNKPSLPDETIAEEEEEKKEEPVGIRQKKRKSSAFQMIKARISRTFSDAGARERLDRRSHSLADLSTSDDTANKRRSIVESEPDLPDSEAFDGVSLSDMSNDEDVATPNEDKQASPKPAKRRKKATKTAKAAKTAKTTLEPNEQDKTKQTSSNGTSSNIMISSVENTNAANIELELEEKIKNPIVEIKTNTIPKIKIVTEQSDGTYKELAEDDEYVKIAETALLTTSVKPIIADTKTVEPVCDDYSNVCKRPNEHNSMCEQISTESKAFDYVQQILTNAIDILKAENLTEPRSEIVGEDAVNEPEIKPETKASVKADLLLHTVLSKEQPNSDSSEDKINDIHVELVSSANSEQGVFTDEATVVKQSTCEELNKGISSNGSNAEEVQLSLKENGALFERVVCRKERSISIDEEPDTKERAMSFEEEAKYVSELNVTLNSTPSTPTTDMAMRLEVNVGKDINIPAGKKIVLMKEMAVQVPDDSVPLDLEKDLGFTDHVACTVSVGVQAGSS
ncbi:uncharacterized protein LOC127853572 [Dreissena polymorpha]|uniref:Uncharacterized protein n=1 Tax=Dreissena polymorpha TaxID=45954 RepID=A0A9D4CSE4_DREPO|nr:uncharacterized protein LOC127853572 [Dreissena polymorpha]XP_052244182.1 uncharacterized protein LOC127853572 [Dreissena polymorpha]XP_052244183.1 uncharacterized protein LOC127853572 [Dreissena polymorpha]KAH3729473.1 hypothetical protein DPMN_055444 [Dreissena polymorpha]